MAIDRSESSMRVPRYEGRGPGGTLTEPEARALLAEFARSGDTLREFAARRGLTPGQLHWWRKKLSVRATAEPAPMIPVLLNDGRASQDSPAAPFVLGLGPERALHIPQQFSEPSLRALLRVLREAP